MLAFGTRMWVGGGIFTQFQRSKGQLLSICDSWGPRWFGKLSKISRWGKKGGGLSPSGTMMLELKQEYYGIKLALRHQVSFFFSTLTGEWWHLVYLKLLSFCYCPGVSGFEGDIACSLISLRLMTKLSPPRRQNFHIFWPPKQTNQVPIKIFPASIYSRLELKHLVGWLTWGGQS